jgi:hypothetical protein
MFHFWNIVTGKQLLWLYVWACFKLACIFVPLIYKVLLLYIHLLEQGVCVSCSFLLYIKMQKAYVIEV